MNGITTVLFDLDGTLLPMDQELFTKTYFKYLVERISPCGYEPEKLIAGVWKGTAAMVQNDGKCSNEEVFWRTFRQIFGDRAQEDIPQFEEFYRTGFQKAKSVCGFHPQAAVTVRKLKEQGYRVFLATNPLFPAVATESRIRWAGLEPEDFEGYTTYENSNHCKPNPDYYRDIAALLQCSPRECLMVGNDVDEDMIAESLGMQVFLLTDCLINKTQKDISGYPRGSFRELCEFLKLEG